MGLLAGFMGAPRHADESAPGPPVSSREIAKTRFGKRSPVNRRLLLDLVRSAYSYTEVGAV